MNLPENIKYTEDHEWAKLDGDVLTIGITDFAQSELGDIIFEGSEMNPWPKGFFDNTQDELSNILKARIYSEEE